VTRPIGRSAIVLAGGDPVEPRVSDLLPADAFVVAADSGVHLAEVLGLRVDCIVGDFDSADPAAVDAAVAGGAAVEQHPVDKDATDLELALVAAQERGAEHVVVVGGSGGRFDHLLANVALLAHARFAGLRIEALVGEARVTVVRGGGAPTSIGGAPGDLVSLLPAGGDARGVTTEGLRFPLHAEALAAGTTRGVSNVLVEVPAFVSLEEGTLLVVQPFGATQ
jgi:thiamine pyrophosphokinase